jgi:hypothetical protein
MSAWLELHTVLSLRLDATEAYRLMHNYRDEEIAKQQTTPLVVSRFDVAMEPAPEEEPVLTVGAIAEDGRPVALLFGEETRRKVASWLAPTAASGEAYDGELSMLRGLIATLRVVAEHGDLPEVRKLLDEHQRDEQDAYAKADEKATATAAPATPGLNERQARLLDAIRTHGGEWTTRRVLHLYALSDPGVVQRGTARRDLETLNRAGHLVLIDDPDKRHYALRTLKGGA